MAGVRKSETARLAGIAVSEGLTEWDEGALAGARWDERRSVLPGYWALV